MPLYDYRCHKCGDIFEVKQKFADPLLTVHEGCGGEVERLISTPSFQFKGSGFYLTDYGRGSNGKSDSKAKSESAKAETKSESKPKADSTPATAPAKPASDK